MSNNSGLHRDCGLAFLAGVAVCLSLAALRSDGQESVSKAEPIVRHMLDTDPAAQSRFLAVPGRRALISGYPRSGLEVWAYPFQVVSGYRVSFRAAGTTTSLRGGDILARVRYEPDGVTRMYLGPDFIVRERLFVPLDEAGAILTYQVEGSHAVEIEVHAKPVLDLMWPGALGRQGTGWDQALSAFVISEPADGYSAAVGSPQIVAHDDLINSTVAGEGSAAIGFTLRPDSTGAARVFVVLNPPHASDAGAALRHLIHEGKALELKASAHPAEYLNSVLRVETPEPEVNEAIAWAEIALDHAWVCNPDLGCGYVAGYGPSRGERRPQYDWFFAGDGLVAAEASIDSSDYARARQELDFILRYQEPKTGMIWHELSQSAGLIDWAGKFPYMYVHVDVSFQFLSTVERYVTVSGDIDFAREHWAALESVYSYCRTLIDPATGLPRIPSDKEGGNEQDRVADDLGLSTSWVQAASAFAHLAKLSGHAPLAEEAERASHLAGASIQGRYWNAEQQFWVSGHTPGGQAAPERRSGPAPALSLHLFSAKNNESLLDRLASSEFQTDWGTRGVGAGSVGYDPGSYAKGSVWAVGTASLANAFWAQHRPVAALGLWRALLPWSALNSPGHMDEVLAGDVYRSQAESVPEQTWSSAGFLDATVQGLLGLNVDSVAKSVTFAPHLPAAWGKVSIAHIRLSDASLSLVLRRTAQGMALEIDNAGPAWKLIFAPELPLGARLGAVTLDRKPIAATLDSHAQETDARVLLDAPHGRSTLHVDWQGGVQVIVDPPAPELGMASSGMRVVGASLEGDVLTIDADIPLDRESHVQLETGWGIAKAEGARLGPVADGHVTLTFAANPNAAASGGYCHARATVQFRK
jgi:glycogen debranching enzyme